MRSAALVLCCLSLCLYGATTRPADQTIQITVDFSKPLGKLKLLNGVCNGPYAYGENAKLNSYHAEAHFPWTRLHDVHWPSPDAVDVSTIFPIFNADADDPKNYTFAKTDDYLAAIVKNHSHIVYRLGESIEPWTHYHNHPPADYTKWTKICLNIIRHYNEGWDNGFHWDIRYWEIWNEPENAQMWSGTRQQYLELYEAAAKAIKAHDPNLKVGGPAATSVHNDLVKAMLAYCRDKKLPLDFFSWHAYYGDPKALAGNAFAMRKLLGEYGFQQTESHLNEWRYLTTWNGLRPADRAEYAKVPEWFARSCREEGAAFCGDVLIRMQDAPVDVMNFYCADTSPWSMFGQFGIPTKVYYAFKAFDGLTTTPNRVAVEGLPKDSSIAVWAGLSDDQQVAGILISHFKGEPAALDIGVKDLSWAGNARVELLAVDANHNFETANDKPINIKDQIIHLDIPTNCIYLVQITRQNAKS